MKKSQVLIAEGASDTTVIPAITDRMANTGRILMTPALVAVLFLFKACDRNLGEPPRPDWIGFLERENSTAEQLLRSELVRGKVLASNPKVVILRLAASQSMILEISYDYDLDRRGQPVAVRIKQAIVYAYDPSRVTTRYWGITLAEAEIEDVALNFDDKEPQLLERLEDTDCGRSFAHSSKDYMRKLAESVSGPDGAPD